MRLSVFKAVEDSVVLKNYIDQISAILSEIIVDQIGPKLVKRRRRMGGARHLLIGRRAMKMALRYW